MPEIVVKDWHLGIGESPIVGFGDMRQVDIHSRRGSLRLEKQATKESGTTITGTPRWTRTYSTGDVYCLDDDGKLYVSTDDGDSWALISGNTLPSAGAGGHGMEIWKDYVFVARASAVDVYSIGGAAWSNSWLAITSASFHPFLKGQDDILYFGNGATVGSILENTGQDFAPGTGASYTTSTSALDLPEGYSIKCLAELGRFLMIGTTQGTNPYDIKIADIFPWDRVSSSFNQPVRIEEFGVHQMLTDGNLLYVNAGTDGRLFVTNGTTVQQVAKIPELVSDGAFIVNYPDALKKYQDGILWGISNGGGTVSKTGVYEFNGGVLTMKNLISTGNDGSSGTVKIGTVLPLNSVYLIGWEDSNASAQGVDCVNLNHYKATSYGALVETPIYRVGKVRDKATFNRLEIYLDAPLATGQGVRVKYRDDLAASWTTLATIDYATYGAIQDYAIDVSVADVVNVQLRIEITTGSSSTSTPSLREVYLR